MSSPAKWSRSRTTRASRSKRSRSWPRIAPGLSACRSPCCPSWATAATTPRSAATRVASPSASTPRSLSTTASRVSATPSRPSPKPAAWSAPSVLWLPQGSLYRYAPGGAVFRRRAVREPTVEAPSNLGRSARRVGSFPSQVRLHLLLHHGPRRLQAQVRAARRRVLRRAPDVVFVPSVWDTRWCSWWPLLLVASVILQLALYPRIHGVCELPEWALLQARVAHQARLRVLLVQARRHSHFWYRADATAKRAPRRAPCRGQLPLRVDTSRRRAELVKTLQFSLRSRGY